MKHAGPHALRAEPAPLTAAALGEKVYLSSAEAALYLGYTADRYKHPLKAFDAFIRRVDPLRLPKCYVGRRLRFRRRDLDKLVSLGRPLSDPADTHRGEG